ncbi:MAG: ABC transporter ATP-binding protein [Candidatus Hodarchaeota archaeon]
MSGTPRVHETATFSSDEFQEAVQWIQERSDEQLLVSIQGSEAFDLENVMKDLPKALIRAGFQISKDIFGKVMKKKDLLLDSEIKHIEVFKEIELQGFVLKSRASYKRRFIAISVIQGNIGDTIIPPGTILTIGDRRSSDRYSDVRANIILLENQFKKNYESRRFYDGRELKEVCGYLKNVIETTQVNGQVWGVWAKTKQVFFGRGKILRVVQKKSPHRRYFIMMLEDGIVGKGNKLERGRIIRIGSTGIFNVEQVIAKKIIIEPQLGEEIKNYDKVLEVENVTVHYGNPNKVKPVIENVNFELEDGEILGIVGESGAGKTTTLKAIIGDLEGYKGIIRVCGINALKKQKVSKLYGYVPQDLSKMYLTYTPLRNILHFGSQYGIPEEELIKRGKEILKDLGIFSKANQPVDKLSGGEKRRTSIAIALVHRPKILFLDEPTSGLDPTTRHELWAYLDRISRQYGTALLVITHYPEESEYCDKVAVFMKGKGFLEFGRPMDLKERLPGGGYAIDITLERFDPDALDLLKTIEDIALILQRGGSIRIFAQELSQNLYDKILKTLNDNGHSVHRIEPKAEIDMIDYFLYRTKTFRQD